MLVVILVYDQLLFRPLVAWADKFRFEQDGGRAPRRSPGSCDLIRAARADRSPDSAPLGCLWRLPDRLASRCGAATPRSLAGRRDRDLGRRLARAAARRGGWRSGRSVDFVTRRPALAEVGTRSCSAA